MARRLHHDDWDDDEPSWADQAGDDDDDYTIPCPWCKRPIHEDAERCPYCEHYISEEDAPPERKPWWIIVGAIICLLIAGYWAICWF
jgi:hypothetical protein